MCDKSPLKTQNNNEINGIANRFLKFNKRYAVYFRSATRTVFGSALAYLKGLMQGQPGKRNIERIAEVVPECNDQALNHMISDSEWSADAVRDQVALDANKLLGGNSDTALLIDDSCIKKSGSESAGVARQWLGRFGKVDNGQVAVCAALTHGQRVSLVDYCLYLPEQWTNDYDRCKKAGIPDEYQTFKTKPQLALEIVARQRKLGVNFGFVGADSGYGNDPQFLRQLQNMDETFMVDVHSDQRIYLTNPNPFIPEKIAGSRGKQPTKYATKECPIEVQNWTAMQPDNAWKRINIGKSTRGPKIIDVLHQRVWSWDGEEPTAHCWHLVVRREVEKPNDIKYSLSNSPENTSIFKLAKMQDQRYWIERSLEDGKSECGLDEYQVRKWPAWQHHMALVLMAMQFMLEERIHNSNDLPLLSCFDIRQLLIATLPKRNLSIDEVIYHMEKRHKKRHDAIESKTRKKLQVKSLE